MNREEPEGSETAAQTYCIENYHWLISTSQRILRRRGLADYGEDLAHDVRNKCKGVNDASWDLVTNKAGYIAKIAIREANRLCHQNGHVADQFPIDNLRSSSTVEAMEAAILIREILSKLTPNEQELIDLRFRGYGEQEIARKLGVSYVALRKRMSRLTTKLNALCSGKRNVKKSNQLVGKQLRR